MSSPLFDALSQLLLHEPLGLVTEPQAAVLVLLSRGDNPAVLYTKRAEHLRQHPGEVCFPGGMWEPGDADLFATAQRETYEEIGLPAADIHLLGRLPQFHTRAGTPVTPFVASFNTGVPLLPSPAELDSIFCVPLRVFNDGIQVREDRFERNGRVFSVPVYHYEGYEIWGFTAAVTEQLLRLLRRIEP
ncbi:NUDIX hydrolase [Cellvibrio sp. OA-2007]|uniref:NUDIX hydrolase n=1 Tax=Cellvibrio sp. OA-2007 TaxID=529823 RepID=UPI000A025C72|nr:CoA pyrophosphatase [Cellvibrio sp. OA-2007]